MLRYIKVCFWVLCGCIFVISCNDTPIAHLPQIAVRLKKDPERLHPMVFANPLSREVYQYIFLPLADYDPFSLEYIPILMDSLPTGRVVKSGEYMGLIRYDIHIKDEAKWDDGTPISGIDYAFTVKAAKFPLSMSDNYRQAMEIIRAVEIDPSNEKHCIVYITPKKYVELQSITNFEIYPAHIYDKSSIFVKPSIKEIESMSDTMAMDSSFLDFAEFFNGIQASKHIVSGAGPYTLKEWESDQKIVLSKKENYWAAQSTNPFLLQNSEKIVFQIIPDEVTALAQFKSGNIDVINELSIDAYDLIKKDSIHNHTLLTPSTTRQYIIAINNIDPKLNSKNVRRALAHLIDVDYLIETMESGMGLRTSGPIIPLKSSYNNALNPIALNEVKAKELLTQEGWNDSDNDGILDKLQFGKKTNMSLDILISGQELGKRLALHFQENAKKVGIEVIITEKPFSAIRSEHLATRQYNLIPTILSSDIDIWEDLSVRWHSDSDMPGGFNEFSYRSTITDSLITIAEGTSDIATKISIYNQIQQQIYEDQPVIFLYSPQNRILVNKKWVASGSLKRPGYFVNTFTLSQKDNN